MNGKIAAPVVSAGGINLNHRFFFLERGRGDAGAAAIGRPPVDIIVFGVISHIDGNDGQSRKKYV